MACKKLTWLTQAYPEFKTVTGRSVGCWSRSWWLIGKEFERERLHPSGVGGILGIFIHTTLIAEYPTFYEKAFFHWKGNMGFASVIDDGYDDLAIYPISPQWVRDFVNVSFFWSRDPGDQPNGCICCINRGDCWQNP